VSHLTKYDVFRLVPVSESFLIRIAEAPRKGTLVAFSFNVH
jgi:hypothetical protein